MKRAWVLGVALLSMAPTVGDVGGCGQDPLELSGSSFAASKKDIDCARCTDCALVSDRCARACNPASLPEDTLPATCHPLVHDGEVCTRALRAASCDDYFDFVKDVLPRVPTECQFCLGARAPGFASDGGGL